MCARLRVGSETADLVELEAECVGEPVDGLARAAGEDLDEVVAGEVACGLLCVIEEDLQRVKDGAWWALSE